METLFLNKFYVELSSYEIQISFAIENEEGMYHLNSD